MRTKSHDGINQNRMISTLFPKKYAQETEQK